MQSPPKAPQYPLSPRSVQPAEKDIQDSTESPLNTVQRLITDSKFEHGFWNKLRAVGREMKSASVGDYDRRAKVSGRDSRLRLIHGLPSTNLPESIEQLLPPVHR